MTKNSVCCTPYLRNHTSYELSFMIQMCKMIVSLGVFFNFKILIFQVFRGLKGQKWPKMTKFSLCHTSHFRNHISYDLHLWYTCIYKRIMYPCIFFDFFFKNLIFRIIRCVGVVKGQKVAQNDKKFCCLTLYLRNCTSYDCDFWYTCVK